MEHAPQSEPPGVDPGVDVGATFRAARRTSIHATAPSALLVDQVSVSIAPVPAVVEGAVDPRCVTATDRSCRPTIRLTPARAGHVRLSVRRWIVLRFELYQRLPEQASLRVTHVQQQ